MPNSWLIPMTPLAYSDVFMFIETCSGVRRQSNGAVDRPWPTAKGRPGTQQAP